MNKSTRFGVKLFWRIIDVSVEIFRMCIVVCFFCFLHIYNIKLITLGQPLVVERMLFFTIHYLIFISTISSVLKVALDQIQLNESVSCFWLKLYFFTLKLSWYMHDTGELDNKLVHAVIYGQKDSLFCVCDTGKLNNTCNLIIPFKV